MACRIACHCRGGAVRVLITGVSGFTGGHLARTFARRGYQVRGLVRQASQRAALEADGIEPAIGSLEETASLKEAVKGVDAVYNIAAVFREAGIRSSAYHVVNATAVGTLIETAAAAGVTRLVHCSTVGVHGDIEQPPANEDAPLRPGDIYQRTKVEGERIARAAAARTGLPVTIARPSGIYGPGDRRLLKLFKGVARRRFVVLGSGNIFYHLTYIDDLVEGLRLCGEVPAAANRTYILAGGEVTTLNELIAIIAEEARVPPRPLKLPVWPVWIAGALCEAICVPLRPLGIAPPLYRRRVDFFTKSRAFDIARARAELGYAPAVGLHDGIRRTLAWYREHGWL
jgi:nucleoside-diphosphate-sugar epimerase